MFFWLVSVSTSPPASSGAFGYAFFSMAVDGWVMIPGVSANDVIRSSGSLHLPFNYIVSMRKK